MAAATAATPTSTTVTAPVDVHGALHAPAGPGWLRNHAWERWLVADKAGVALGIAAQPNALQGAVGSTLPQRRWPRSPSARHGAPGRQPVGFRGLHASGKVWRGAAHTQAMLLVRLRRVSLFLSSAENVVRTLCASLGGRLQQFQHLRAECRMATAAGALQRSGCAFLHSVAATWRLAVVC